MPTELLESIPENPSDNSKNGHISYADVCIFDEQDAAADALNAVQSYTENPININSYERSQCFSLLREIELPYKNSDDRQAEKNCNSLRDYLNTGQLPVEMILFRGTSLGNLCNSIVMEHVDPQKFFQDCIDLSDEELNKRYGAQVFTYGQFVSTSISYDSACDFISYPNPCMLKIQAPKGTACRCVDRISNYSGEQEVLLTSNIKFQFVKIQTGADGMKTISLSAMLLQNAGNNHKIQNW